MQKIWNPSGQRPKGDQGIRWYRYITEKCVACKEALFPFSFNWHGLNMERKSTQVFKWRKQDTERCLEYEPIWGGKRDIPFSLSLSPLHTYLHMLEIFLEGHPRDYHLWLLGTEHREGKYQNFYFPFTVFQNIHLKSNSAIKKVTVQDLPHAISQTNSASSFKRRVFQQPT